MKPKTNMAGRLSLLLPAYSVAVLAAGMATFFLSATTITSASENNSSVSSWILAPVFDEGQAVLYLLSMSAFAVLMQVAGDDSMAIPEDPDERERKALARMAAVAKTSTLAARLVGRPPSNPANPAKPTKPTNLGNPGKKTWMACSLLGLAASLLGLLSPFVLRPATERGGASSSSSSSAEPVRAGLSFASTFYFFRVVDLFDRRELFVGVPVMGRMAHVFLSFHDIRLCAPHPRGRHLSFKGLGKVLGHGLTLAVLGYAVLQREAICQRLAAPHRRACGSAVGTVVGGAIFMYSLELFGACLELAAALFAGYRLPKLMDRPLGATSLADFWGRRWDTVVQGMLVNVYAFVAGPLLSDAAGCPRRPARAVALMATFFASGIWHAYPIIVLGIEGPYLCMMIGYFLVQGVLCLVERQWKYKPGMGDKDKKGGDRRANIGGRGAAPAAATEASDSRGGSTLLGRVWTLCCVVLPSPLILAPFFKVCGGEL